MLIFQEELGVVGLMCPDKAGTYTLALGGSIDQLLTESFPVLIARSVLDDDLTVVVRQLEDDVLVLLGKLKVVVGSYAVLRDGSTIVGSMWLALRSPPKMFMKMSVRLWKLQ